MSRFLSNPIVPQMLDHARHISLTLLRGFVDQPSYVLGVTSAVAGEGKTTLSLALAEVMASDFGLKVGLMDSHPERPWSVLKPEFEAHSGMSDWLSGDQPIADAMLTIHDKYALLPSGQVHMTARDLLQNLNKGPSLQELRERFSLLILDLPELSNPSCPALANLCDGLVLVARAGSTPADAIKEYLPVLQNVTIHGVILNQHKSAVPAVLRRLFA